MAIAIPGFKPRVRETETPSVRLRDTSAPLNRANQQLVTGGGRAAAGFVNLAQRVEKEQNNAAFNGAVADLSARKQFLLEDPEQGYVVKKGENALEAREQALKNMDEDVQRISRGLKNEKVKRAFEDHSARERLRFLHSVDTHASRESMSLEQQKAEAVLASQVNEAMGAARRSEGIDAVHTAIGAGTGTIEARAEVLGWTPEITKQAVLKYETQAHLGVINTYLEAGDHEMARGHLLVNKDRMDQRALQASNIDERIEKSGLRERAAKLAVDMWTLGEEDPQAAMDALAEQGDRVPIEVRDEAERRIRHMSKVRDEVRRASDAPKLLRLEGAMLETGGFSTTDDDFLTLSREGRNNALKMRDAALRSRRSAAADMRREQRELDQLILATYNALPLVGEDGQDQLTIDLDSGIFVSSSPRMRQTLKGLMGENKRRDNAERRVTISEMEATMNLNAREFGISEFENKRFKEYARIEFKKWERTATDPGKGVPAEVVNGWFAEWYGKKDVPGWPFGLRTTQELGLRAIVNRIETIEEKQARESGGATEPVPKSETPKDQARQHAIDALRISGRAITEDQIQSVLRRQNQSKATE